jgi:hypothetical protein
MTFEQKSELISLIAESQEAAVAYGIVYEKTQRGEYVREDVWKARGEALKQSVRAVSEYIRTI